MKRLSLIKTGNNLYNYRKSARVTMNTLASSLCISKQAIYGWEKGDKLPTIDHLAELADIYGCTMDELIVMEEV